MRADLTEAYFWHTIITMVDLSQAKGLETCTQPRPSSLDILTLRRAWSLSQVFLQGCGPSDIEIASTELHEPGLTNEKINDIVYRMFDLRATQAIQINPLFISYNRGDKDFVDLIGSKLTEKGVRYLRDIIDATSGRLEKQIDRAMRVNSTVLIILSERSVKSDWVQHEVRKARKIELETGEDYLCPI